MNSAYYVGDRLCLLHDGKIRFDGTKEEMQSSEDPVVQAFVTGEPIEEVEETERAAAARRRAPIWWRGR